MEISFPIYLVFSSCSVSTLLMEQSFRENPNCGAQLTLIQFFAMSLIALYVNLRFDRSKTPIKYYFLFAIIISIITLANNSVIQYGVSVPIQMILRCGSLFIGLLVGTACFGRKYSISKKIGCFLVSIGLLLVMIPSTLTFSNDLNNNNIIGCFLLFISLLLSSFLGFFQETIQKRYSAHWSEGMFFTHMFGFIILLPYSTSIQTTNSPTMIIHSVLQAACVCGVYMISHQNGTLTATFTITLRKFFSILFNVWYFEHSFMWNHWLSVVVIMIGSILYNK